MKTTSKTITSDKFAWSQHPIANQLIYTITSFENSLIAGGQFLSAAKIDHITGELLWSHPGTAFRTTEFISNDSSITAGGQYNSYAWEQLDSSGNRLRPNIPKHANEVYGSKAFLHKNNFWEIYSTTPRGLSAEYFEFHIQINHNLLFTNTTANLNPLAIAIDKQAEELYLAGWKGLEQHQAQLYKIDLKATEPILTELPQGLITAPNLVKGDQLVINEMRWDQQRSKLVFVGDAHSYNSSAQVDYGILGSYDQAEGLTIKKYPFNGFIGSGSVESFQTLDELANGHYLIAGNDSTSPTKTLGNISIARKSDLSIKETILVDIQNSDFDHIKDILVDDSGMIYMGGSGGVHKIGKSTDLFDSLIDNNTIKAPKKFKQKFTNKITNFNPSTDTLEIDTNSFGIGSNSATFAAGKNKKIVKKKLAKQDLDFLYDQKKGGLYFNENGSEKGFGDGGIAAILKGAPDLTSDHLEFI